MVRNPVEAAYACSSVGAGSWMTGPATWPARAEGRRPEQRSMAVRGGDSGAGAAPRSAGEPAYPMSYIGAGEGLRPLRTPDRGEFSPGPSITPAAPVFLSPDRGLDGARSDGKAFDHNGEGLRPLREERWGG